MRYASIPEATFKKLHNADPESARLMPEYGGGYIGFLEVSHHLHVSPAEDSRRNGCLADRGSYSLQCLNLLRMGIHQDYYMQEAHKPEIFRDRPWTIKLHFGTSIASRLTSCCPIGSLADHTTTDHCIEMLRQNIMCNADVGIIPHHWIKQSPDPFANFNTWHKCRDIGSVERWIEEHAIPEMPDGGSLPRPKNDKVWPEPP